jgi:hypothetical protein
VTAVLTLAEVAEHFRQPEKFIRRLAATKQVPCLRGSRGAYLFTEAHVEAIERSLTQQPLTQMVAPARRRRSA